MEADGELIVAPRFSLIVPKERVKVVCDYGQSIGVEVGRWFSDSPPIWRQESCRVYGCKNAKYISERIVNVSCHWTLSEKEINKVKGFLSEISVIIR